MTTYSPIGGLALIGTGEESGTWGTITNLNLRGLDRGAHGFVNIDLTSAGSTYLLQTNNITQSSDLDQNGHYKGLRFHSSTTNVTVTIKSNDATTEYDQTKVYMVMNATSNDLIFDQNDVPSQITIAAGQSKVIFAAGGTLYDMSSSLEMDNVKINGGDVVSDNVTISGGTITGLSSPLPVASGGTNANNEANARANLGLGINSDIMGFDDNLDALRTANATQDNHFIVTDTTGDLQFESGNTVLASIGLTAQIDDLDKTDVTTDGTAQASKCVVLDANKDIIGLRNVEAISYDEKFIDNGTTATFDINTGSIFLYEPTATAVTLVFSNLPGSTDTGAKTFTLIVRPNGVNPTITWPTSVSWTNGYAPPDPNDAEVKLYTFLCIPTQGAGGVPSVYGFLAGDNFY